MRIIKIYNPKFDEFHGRPVVTWCEGDGPVRTDMNLYEQYARWKSDKIPRHEPRSAFWESNGPAIVRALMFCGAKALMLEYVDRVRVCYRWIAAGPPDHRHLVCSVEAKTYEGGTRVSVQLPTDEEVVFMFHSSQMESWLKPKPAEAPKTPENIMSAEEKQDHYRLGEG